MPFGLSTAPGTFQKLMDLTMCGLTYDSVLVYLDDLVILANSFDQLMERFEVVLGRLRAANLKLNCGKCELFRRKVSFLGHIISGDGQKRLRQCVVGPSQITSRCCTVKSNSQKNQTLPLWPTSDQLVPLVREYVESTE